MYCHGCGTQLSALAGDRVEAGPDGVLCGPCSDAWPGEPTRESRAATSSTTVDDLLDDADH
jgi:hypothetical protein